MRSDEFIGCTDAVQRYDIDHRTLRRRIHRGDLEVYRDPLDDRRKLLKVSDIERLATPKPLPRRERAAASVA